MIFYLDWYLPKRKTQYRWKQNKKLRKYTIHTNGIEGYTYSLCRGTLTVLVLLRTTRHRLAPPVDRFGDCARGTTCCATFYTPTHKSGIAATLRVPRCCWELLDWRDFRWLILWSRRLLQLPRLSCPKKCCKSDCTGRKRDLCQFIYADAFVCSD